MPLTETSQLLQKVQEAIFPHDVKGWHLYGLIILKDLAESRKQEYLINEM
jgi:hypothetical protein